MFIKLTDSQCNNLNKDIDQIKPDDWPFNARAWSRYESVS